jgi:hypothetical protein
MKTTLLTALGILLGLTLQAQLKIGVNGGLPIGDLSDEYAANFGADIYYYFVGGEDDFYDFGLTAGYSLFTGNESEVSGVIVDVDNAQFMPLALAGRVNLWELLTAGADIGYGLGLNDGNDGGFYYRLAAGLDFGAIEISALLLGYNFEAPTGTSSLNSFGIGLLYELGRN